MSQQHPNLVQSAQVCGRGSIRQIADAHHQANLTIDLMIMEAGLRLKVLPLRDAILRGRQLNFSDAKRRARRRALFALNGQTQLNIVDVGLFADAVARRPDVAERLWRALRSSAKR
jgi:hypothetical protein